MSKTADGNVGLAFAFVICAGLATTLGSTFAFCGSLADQRYLACALGVSAGVMLYVSFGEIFMVKSVEAFEESGYTGDEATRYATFCFFGGISITALLDKVVHFIADRSGHKHDHAPSTMTEGIGATTLHNNPISEEARGMQMRESASEQQLVTANGQSLEEGGVAGEESAEKQEAHRKNELQKMGLLTGLAIALHNFPEGLATFVATLADTTVGAAIALAIALHNIPEGVCVAMPIYYATGSRWKGFWWSVASGVSEPLGGLLGYLVLYGDNMSDVAYGSLFGCVGGMMVYISVVELIPTALKYDPEDKYVTNSVLVGMGVMAASLLLFVL
mmetsp:Transcript_16649/g.36202  ORF Transcript_16649/g.36202 Transcript_16649/m.36202 type:complete len:332 (-) Transcript_16649:120-1115(-)|eukprot:CAMPEP_0118930700 /NCGR_PEP_ID=MMETSP1169-20130426/7295_1 /TAXON_ID=36882 /ORGANISM="Pyramimonas obovata, Strain CCMP722" /LENGTH=331 /DNA_ID=CAMNT_0006873091 /DNA_START=356 /DNA_END=1351 /DNA_ORIENTATION=+